MFGLERNLKKIFFQAPCYEQRHLTRDQVVESPVQLGPGGQVGLAVLIYSYDVSEDNKIQIADRNGIFPQKFCTSIPKFKRMLMQDLWWSGKHQSLRFRIAFPALHLHEPTTSSFPSLCSLQNSDDSLAHMGI